MTMSADGCRDEVLKDLLLLSCPVSKEQQGQEEEQ